MKAKDLRKKSAADLMKLLKSEREALSKFRFGLAGAKTKDVKEGRNRRKTVARIFTLLREEAKKTSL